MHIAYLHYLTSDASGLHHVRQFAEAARRLGHRVDIHAMNFHYQVDDSDGPSPPPSLAQRLRRRLKRRFARWLHEPKEFLWNFKYVRREVELLSAEPPDLLLVRDHIPTASCVTTARRLGLPLILEMNAPAEELRLFLDAYVHYPLIPDRLERHKVHGADAITVVSGALRDYLVDKHRVTPDKFTVNPNGGDLQRFHPEVPVDDALPDSWAGQGPVVGFVGSFETWHGSGLLATMASRVGRLRPQCRFLFVGDGPQRHHLLSATADLGDRAHLTGWVDHHRVAGLVAAFDVGVVAAAGFYMSPLKVVEWMAAGRAVVAPRQGPLQELIDDGVHGLLFTPDDADALIDCVLRLVDDAALRRRLGTAAHRRVRDSLTWKHNAERVLEVAQRTLAAHSPRSTDQGSPSNREEA